MKALCRQKSHSLLHFSDLRQKELHGPVSFSTGVLFLQFGDETRRVHITHELSSIETLHALIVHMFPQKLTASMLKSPNTAILIKDEARNVFYELEDVRDIQDRSIIKIHRKEPAYGSYTAAAHLVNGDLRVGVGVCLCLLAGGAIFYI